MLIRAMDISELSQAMQLIWEVFQEFVAPDYEPEGIESFRYNFVESEWFRERFRSGREKMYGAFWEGKLAGVVSVSTGNTVSCIFVKGSFHKKGIGRALLEYVAEVLRAEGVHEIRLNASPYAVPFYLKMGFEAAGGQGNYQGIIYTPMRLWF